MSIDKGFSKRASSGLKICAQEYRDIRKTVEFVICTVVVRFSDFEVAYGGLNKRCE